MARKSRREYLGGLGSVGLLGLAGCSSGDTQDNGSGADDTTTTTTQSNQEDNGGAENVLIGNVQIYSGEYSWVGSNVWPGVQLAIEDINAYSGEANLEFSAKKEDSKATSEAAVNATQKLVNVDGVMGMVGYSSFNIMSVYEMLQQSKVGTLHFAGIPEADPIGGEYIFRGAPSDIIGGRALGLVADEQGMSSMALMAGQASGLQGFKEPIRKAFTDAGGTIEAEVDFQVGKSSYNAEVNSALEANPDGVWVMGKPQDTASILRTAYERGFEGEFIVADDQATPDFLKLTSPEVTDGTLSATPGGNPEADDRITEFASRFEEKADQEYGSFSLNAYDCTLIQSLAATAAKLENGEVTREGMAAQLPKVATAPGTEITSYEEGAAELESGNQINYQGMASKFEFNNEGNIAGAYYVQQVQDNKWERTGTIPETDLV